MRLHFAILLLALTAPAYGQDAEAEKLFRAMEEKIMAAKSLKVVIKWWNRGPSDASNITITLQIAEGNKARVNAKGNNQDRHIDMILVSNGEQTVIQSNSPEINQRTPTPAGQNEFITAMLTRTGFLNYDWLFRADQDFDAKKLKTGGFKLGPKLQENKRQYQWLEYPADLPRVQLLVDLETLLPVRRRTWVDYKTADKPLTGSQGPSESYSEFVLNPKLDPKLFALPN